MAQAKTTNTPILDLVGLPEFFVTELAVLENLGPCYRPTFTVEQSNTKGNPELVPVCKVIMSAEAVQQMLTNLPLLTRNLPVSDLNRENQLNLN